MDHYIVSARKYRPTTFGEVVGQDVLTQTLRNAIFNGKLAHAYLFCGPRGVGKTTCARIFAKTINCLSPTSDGEACGHCESCKAFNEGRSFTIHELDAASNNGVDEIRTLITQVQVPPQIGKYKVFIIDEVHMLTTSAFNAFLKTLEEPPAHAIFILATTEKHKILPTILSRCQIYDFKRMEVPEIINHLKRVATTEKINADEQALAVIAEKADGGMRDALSIFDQVANFTEGNVTYEKTIKHLNVLDSDYYFSVIDHAISSNIPQLMLTLNDVIQRGFDPQHFIGGLANHLRSLLVASNESTLHLLETSPALRDKYITQAKKLKSTFVFQAIKICNNCDLNYRTSRNKRLMVEIALIELGQLSENGTTSTKPQTALRPIFRKAPVQKAPAQTQVKAELPKQMVITPTGQLKAAPTPQVQPTQRQAPRIPQTISLREANNITERKKDIQPTTIPSSNIAPSGGVHEQIFTLESVGYHWRCFLNQLPKEYTATVGRLINIIPEKGENNEAILNFDGEHVEQCFNSIKEQCLAYMRKQLNNDKFNFSSRIIVHKTPTIALTQREQWNILLEKNKIVAMLNEALQLELE